MTAEPGAPKENDLGNAPEDYCPECGYIKCIPSCSSYRAPEPSVDYARVWWRCEKHDGYGFTRDCVICNDPSLKINAAEQDNKASLGNAAPSSGRVPNTPRPASAAPEPAATQGTVEVSPRQVPSPVTAAAPDVLHAILKTHRIEGSTAGALAVLECGLFSAHAQGLAEGLEEGARTIWNGSEPPAKDWRDLATGKAAYDPVQIARMHYAAAIRAKIKPRTDEREGK